MNLAHQIGILKNDSTNANESSRKGAFPLTAGENANWYNFLRSNLAICFQKFFFNKIRPFYPVFTCKICLKNDDFNIYKYYGLCNLKFFLLENNQNVGFKINFFLKCWGKEE